VIGVAQTADGQTDRWNIITIMCIMNEYRGAQANEVPDQRRGVIDRL